MAMTVGAWGYEAVAAVSEQQAIENLRGNPPRLVIADWRLRDGHTGGDAIRRLCQLFGIVIPALIVTGETAPGRLKEIAQHGWPVLHKPVSPPALRKAVEHSLSTH